jgi:DNA invertase Pin-like site-specific DNA recombinase
MRSAVAYLRKSSAGGPRSVSYDAQAAAVRDLAAHDGIDNIAIISDWAISGKSTRGRPQYQALIERIRADEVSTIYSFSYSRLSRSLLDFAQLLELCRDHRVRIVTHQEGVTDLSTATGRAFAGIAGVMAALERELGSERTKAAHEARRERGDVVGTAPYGYRIADGKMARNPDEPVDTVLAAFDTAGSAFGAARILNRDGLRTRRGALWSSKVVRDVAKREGRHVGSKRQGAKIAGDWLFYQLLTCPCGQTMTPMDRRGPRYTCYRSRQDPAHSSPFSISEAKLMPLIQAEASRYRLPESVITSLDTDRARQDIDAKRARVIDLAVEGVIDKSDRDRRLAAIDAQIANLDARTRIIDVPALDWKAPARAVNDVLRTFFARIELGTDLLPRADGFVWRLPQEYVAP